MLSDAKSGHPFPRLTNLRKSPGFRRGLLLAALVTMGATASFGQKPANNRPNAFDKAQSQIDKVKPKMIDIGAFNLGNVAVPPAAIGETVSFKVPVYNKQGGSPTYLYALQGNPMGSFIDPHTGDFTWVPRTSGTFTFYVWVADQNDLTKEAYTQITITVNPNLQLFGYSIFSKARAVINTRMMLLKAGMLQGVGTVQSLQPNVQQSLPLSGTYPGFAPAGAAGSNPYNGSPLFNQGTSPGQQPLFQQGQPQPSIAPGQFVPPISPFLNGTTPAGPTVQVNPTNAPKGASAMVQAVMGSGSQPMNSGPMSPFAAAIANAAGMNNQGPNFQAPSGNPAQTSGTPDSNQPFASSGPAGLSIVPSSGFADLGNLTYSSSGPNGVPNGTPSMTANALQYLVGPIEEMGMNVYLPYPERYQLGPGDLLTARIWSTTMQAQDYDLKVDQLGRLSLPSDTDKIVVRGLTLAKAQDVLKERVSELFKSGKLTLTLKALRTMSVQILGDAYMPGNYQVPAVATLFNTLIVCGGPTDQGSLRRVELRRTDGTTQTFDLYAYLTRGDTKADVPLQPGDVIFIPSIRTRVNVRGEVGRPAIYETLPKDTLKEILQYAGGAKSTGVSQRVQVETEDPGVGHTVKDVDVSNGNPSTPLFDGDTITVFSVREEVLNDIRLDGAVDQPGVYEYRKGLTFADVITRARGLRMDAYRPRADLYRRNPDLSETLIPIDLEKALARDPSANVELLPHDRIRIYRIDDAEWRGDRKVAISGAVQRPGNYARQEGEKLMDLLLQAGGVTGEAFLQQAILQRTNPDGTLGPLFRIDLRKLAIGDPQHNIVLQDRDLIKILSVQDAQYVPDQSVNILGAVQNPGNYARGSNMKLSDLLHEAGGLMPNAGAVIEIKHARVPETTPAIRVKVSEVQAGMAGDIDLQDGDLVTVAEDSTIQLHPKKIIIVGEVKNPGPYSVSSNDRLTDIIERAGGLRENAFAQGLQFYRDPNQLVTDTQAKLMPQIQETLKIVAQDEFTRALALADVQKIRLIQSGSGSANSGSVIPLLSGSSAPSSAPATVPQALWDEKTVTQARDIANLLTPSGNVSVHLLSAMRRKGGTEDILLADGDIIVVPKTPSTTSILGAVVIPSAVLFESGKNVGYYVDRAGGFSADAAKNRMIIIRADGLVEKATRGTRVNLGDQILVPTQVMAVKFQDKAAEIEAVSKQVTAGAIVFALLKSLIK